jgi:hypothetical protein
VYFATLQKSVRVYVVDRRTEDINRKTEGLRRRVRLVILLHTAGKAGLTPLPILRLHTFAFLSNVLAPVWQLPTLDGKILKRRGGPFYPDLQHDLDRIVGMGLAKISRLSHELDHDQRWRLEGAYELNVSMAGPILTLLSQIPEEAQILGFFQELAYAISTLSDDEIDMAMTEDATYADPIVDTGSVVDFGEWQHRNASVNASRQFGNHFHKGVHVTPGEKLHLYVRHLRERMQSA